MDLRITSNAKNNQISFLIALNNFLTRRNYTKASLAIKQLNQFLKQRNPDFNIRVKEGTGNSIELYADKSLIGYYA